ncbi:hypothetical protein MHD_06715 [Mannheimia granulomatis]|uniref:site-specific DNA-methyltransferase (adenine-specific) n=1 Tax=Mannheimia granulomatis TaxID=85402 RepID=A0A011MJY7_9PAST|nr:DNA adenine methylase [Mannheimia granulomatis]EXI62811.1 DNA methyltransferase [Mannheimia granulomatis]RGE48167.1 hypothetical protein MHD_06715 [Mannheimia granulomatis]
MKRSPSPLRYPGGKACIFDMTKDILVGHNLNGWQYAEPYAGGCGLALSLLFDGIVSRLHLNDIDPSIATFWESVLVYTDELAERVENAVFTIEEWRKQKQIQKAKLTANPIDLAFSTLYLNRTNRSGIIGAGVIGGLAQTGNYKMDCRFNKVDIISKIYAIAKRQMDIYIYNLDAIDFIKKLENQENLVLMIDPPYYNKGQTLYANFYRHDDHAKIADILTNTTLPWILTYDNTLEIIELYQDFNKYSFSINYSVAKKRVGNELLIASPIFNQLTHHHLTFLD